MSTREKILPAVYPPVNAYLHQSALFSMLFARDECIPWIYNNFLQVYSLKDLYLHTHRPEAVDFYYNLYGDFRLYYFRANPWIRYSAMPLSDLNIIKMDYIDFLKYCIDRNQYLYFYVDRYYIPVYINHFMQRHQKHGIFIYGYDDETANFFICDHIVFGKCKQDKVAYKDLLVGLGYIGDPDGELRQMKEWQTQLYRMEVMDKAEVRRFDDQFEKDMFEINISQIVSGVKEYLLESDYIHHYDFSKFYVFGLDCYDELSKYAGHAAHTNQQIDIRGFYSFSMHKKMMALRLDYLSERYGVGEIAASYGMLVKDFEILINMIILANVKQSEKSKLRIIDKLADIKKRETALLREFINCVGESYA